MLEGHLPHFLGESGKPSNDMKAIEVREAEGDCNPGRGSSAVKGTGMREQSHMLHSKRSQDR